MTEKKRVWRAYSMWEFEREAAELNRLSDEGWQLVKPRAFGFSLERNDAVRYRYRLDRNQKPDDRYYASFAEQGWENAGRVNGWTYFRKPYDPALPEGTAMMNLLMPYRLCSSNITFVYT